ncbi:hypothetical protein [Henriciella sp.]|uniref:hypothetical protein n=1 Tax=Henriciella sp. TaxID=1968823 RepID=UPI0026376A1A|nr:hypothetical protein [Henriciella sp.]
MSDKDSDREKAQDPSERPDFLILGWRDFIGRLVFVFSFLGFLTLVFLSMTGLWRAF